MIGPRVYVSIVTYNSLALHGEPCLKKCLDAVFAQRGFEAGSNLFVRLCDNASEDGLEAWVKRQFADAPLKVSVNAANLGFSAAHNQNIQEALDWGARYVLILNPDVALQPQALSCLTEALERDPQCGSATPCLYRADAELAAVTPRRFDAAGMYITRALRHFDRGSGEVDQGQYAICEYVFGGSGACLLLRSAFIEDAALDAGELEKESAKVFPQLRCDSKPRLRLFDEGFFAYREDADLSWRGQLLGWRCLYVPEAQAFHRRVVLPERRRALAPELNLHSVRNRFLLQVNNYVFGHAPWAFLEGVLLRNLLVILGVCLWE
ncbi:MAG: glycosyltransferase family 2 protein, partial [Deltaproteobacteria bacterium]|nr:glycosyltransferase family 2 protein [Deltaproteobacteria bacterium]